MAQGVLMDIAGVLYDGDHAIARAPEAVDRLRDAGLPVRFLTNSTRQPRRAVLHKLSSFGIHANEHEVLTPAKAACDWLVRNEFSPHLLIHPDLAEDFSAVPTDGPTAVVVGDAGPYFNFEQMNAAFRHLVNGAPLLALAVNRMFRDADGKLSLDAGAFVRALEYASGVSAILLGKPSPDFFDTAAKGMGLDLAEVAMIGDDAESDVAGALSAGANAGILTKTGKYRSGDENRFEPSPTHLVDDVFDAAQWILSHPQ